MLVIILEYDWPGVLPAALGLITGERYRPWFGRNWWRKLVEERWRLARGGGGTGLETEPKVLGGRS